MTVAYIESLQPSQSGYEAAMCNDGNENTIYHSLYNLSTAIPDQLNLLFIIQTGMVQHNN
ncbi:hypothetical protein REB14_02040 [Chryseobacterium sp. ES2]|uniref:Uncharacterized protein n=1 Tax=Chryseobacterium metallicongregator TaxID=3073042 RepID=A0ABU1DZI5_9FLAO|nr:hypothetical protein [Chryseobacterium sp. ES2]MDR4950960.1 hypothetical protein [Chryseobacterium sp. ES2]